MKIFQMFLMSDILCLLVNKIRVCLQFFVTVYLTDVLQCINYNLLKVEECFGIVVRDSLHHLSNEIPFHWPVILPLTISVAIKLHMMRRKYS